MSGWIIKCKMPSGERGYIGDDFTPDAKQGHVFPTLDAAKRVKDKLDKNLEAKIIPLDKPKRGSKLKKAEQ